MTSTKEFDSALLNVTSLSAIEEHPEEEEVEVEPEKFKDEQEDYEQDNDEKETQQAAKLAARLLNTFK